jgi:cellulose biosynthesis protein BcsQ
MKIAFAGKGGSGKTTLSSLFVRHLAAQGLPVVAIDADINQHLAAWRWRRARGRDGGEHLALGDAGEDLAGDAQDDPEGQGAAAGRGGRRPPWSAARRTGR